MRILAVGDSYMPSSYFRAAFAMLEQEHDVERTGGDRGNPPDLEAAGEVSSALAAVPGQLPGHFLKQLQATP